MNENALPSAPPFPGEEIGEPPPEPEVVKGIIVSSPAAQSEEEKKEVVVPEGVPIKVIHVKVDPSLSTDIIDVKLHVQCAMTVGACIDRMASIVGADRRRLALTSEDNHAALSVWTPVLDEMRLIDEWSHAPSVYHMVNVYVANNNCSFLVPADTQWTNVHFLQYLGTVLGCPHSSLLVTDMAGKPWTFPQSYKTSSNVRAYSALRRGGMRSVSTTAPWRSGSQAAIEVDEEGDADNDPAREEDLRQWMMEDVGREPDAHAVPTRQRSRSRDQQEQLGAPYYAPPQDPESEEECWSSVWPASSPPAQPERVSRPVFHEQERYGKVFASPHARVIEVLDDLVDKLRPFDVIEVVPNYAVDWSHVVQLEVRLPPPSECHDARDLRKGRWEKLQKIRHVPLLEEGIVIKVFLFPWFLPMEEAQQRLEDIMFRDLSWRITAVDHENWVVTSPTLPDHVRHDLFQFRQMHRTYQRGGAKHRILSMLPQPAGRKFQYAFASSSDDLMWFQAECEESVVAELVCVIAYHQGVSTDYVVVTTEAWLPKLEDPIKVYKGHIFYVFLMKNLYLPDFIFTWPWELHVIEQMAFQQIGRRLPTSSVREQPTPVAGPPVTFYPVAGSYQRRGGGRGGQQADSEATQRQYMSTWALDKCQKACPEVSLRLAKTLMREWRLVNAINNSRSKVQIRHAVIAALKRASLEQLALQMEAGHNDLGQELDQNDGQQHATHEVPAGTASHHEASVPQQPVSQVQGEVRQLQQQLNDQIATMTPSLNDLRQDMQWVQNALVHTHALVQCQNMTYMPQQVGVQLQTISASQVQISDAVQMLQTIVSHLDRRMTVWENNYLPAMFERMAEIQPIPATPEEAEETQVRSQAVQADDRDDETQYHDSPRPRQEGGGPVPVPQDNEGVVSHQDLTPEHHVGLTNQQPTIVQIFADQAARSRAAQHDTTRRALTPFGSR